MKHLAIAIGAASCALSAAHGQGLMDIGSNLGDGVRLPFSLFISSSAGWDSNPRASSSTGPRNGPGAGTLPEGAGSTFWQNAFNLHYPLGRGRHRFSVTADYSNTWYFDPPQGTREFQNTGGLHLDYFRPISQRLTLGDTAYFTHQTAPDFQVGASINRPTSGYYYFSNNLSARYNLTSRLSAVTSHTVSSISYDEEALQGENNITHVVSEGLRYSLTQKTTATLDYRLRFSQYPDNPAADSRSHFILLGVRRPIGRFLSMSLSGGAEFRSYDGPLGSRTDPYSEGAINYHARKNTTFRAYFRSGVEDTGSAGSQSSLSQRAGLALSQRLAPGLSLSASLDYINSDFTGSPVGLKNRKEDTFYTSVGLNYYRRLWRRLGLNANYSYSMVSSDDPFSEYQRHRVSLGLSTTF